MRYALVNCSPKPKDSNSEYFLNLIQKLLDTKDDYILIDIKKSSSNTFEDMCNCDKIIFASPIYVDSLPSNFLYFLMEFEAFLKNKPSKKISIYSILNCGFYEGNQNKIAMEIIKNWCVRCGLQFNQGIGIGAGEMMGSIKDVPLGHGPTKNLGIALTVLKDNINKNLSGEDMYISPNFPRFLFLLSANRFWISKAKSNKINKKDILTKLK